MRYIVLWLLGAPAGLIALVWIVSQIL